MNVNLKNDLSVLTTIKEQTFDKLLTKVIWCISDSVEKAILNKDEIVNIDTGIGNLLISISNKEVKYKFIPGKNLDDAVVNTIVNEQNELVTALEESLVTKMTNVVKDFF